MDTLRSEANRDGTTGFYYAHSNSAGLVGSARLYWVLVKVLHPASILLKAQYFKSILNCHEWSKHFLLLAWHKPFPSLSKSYCLCSLKVGLLLLQKKSRGLSHSTRLDNSETETRRGAGREEHIVSVCPDHKPPDPAGNLVLELSVLTQLL